MSADLYFTTDSSSFFFRPLISEVAEWNSTKIGHIVGSNCSLKAHDKIWGIRSPYKSGAQKPPFSRISQLNRNFNGLWLRNERWYRQCKCVDNHKGSLTSSQNNMNFGPQRASNWTVIFPTLRKFSFLLHCQASQTNASKQNSAVESTKGLLRCRKISWTYGSQTAWNRTGVFTHPHYFVLFQSIALCGINVAPHSNSKWHGYGFVCSSGLKPQMLSRPVALSGNIHRYNCDLF